MNTGSRGGPGQFPIAPFVRLMALDPKIVKQDSPIWRTYHRALLRGFVGASSADELAVRILGLHPALVWGASWWIEDAA